MLPNSANPEAALAKFVEANPHLIEEMQALSPQEQQQQIQWAFDDEADSRGLQPWEYALELIARSPEELKAMRLEVHREVAEALGMAWEEYCQFNALEC